MFLVFKIVKKNTTFTVKSETPLSPNSSSYKITYAYNQDSGKIKYKIINILGTN